MSRTLAKASTLALICSVCVVTQAGSSSTHSSIVRVSTAEEVVAAMVAAKNSRRPTLIKVAPGTYEFTETFPGPDVSSLLPPVDTLIAIVGKDSETTLFQARASRARFATVLPRGGLLIRGVTMSGGAAFCENFCDSAQIGGGAVANLGGYVWLQDSVLSRNSSSANEGIGLGFGGAVLNASGHMSIDSTVITENSSLNIAGGIALLDGTLFIRKSLISGNRTSQGFGQAGGNTGGGIYVDGGTLWVDSSTITGNLALTTEEDPNWGGFGGGLNVNGNGTVWMRDSAVTENRTLGWGAGGGIHNSGKMVLENTTVAGNSTGTLGGGIFNSGQLTLRNVTIARNELRYGSSPLDHFPTGCAIDALEFCFARGDGLWNEPGATVRVSGSAIANNGETDCAGGLIQSLGYNAIGTNLHCTLQSTTRDQINVDARLGEVEDNGEPGEARVPLLADSPLIDAGGKVGNNCPRRDQLGHRRTDGDGDGVIRCDIGAVEFRGAD